VSNSLVKRLPLGLLISGVLSTHSYFLHRWAIGMLARKVSRLGQSVCIELRWLLTRPRSRSWISEKAVGVSIGRIVCSCDRSRQVDGEWIGP
jgi:hypothetical protein